MNTTTENLVTAVDDLKAAVQGHDPDQHEEPNDQLGEADEVNEPEQPEVEPEQEAESPAEETDPEQEENEDEVSDDDTDAPPSPDQPGEAATDQEEIGGLPDAEPEPEAGAGQEPPSDDPPATSHPEFNRITNVPVDGLIPDPDTPRQMTRSKDEMEVLASNIGRMGVLNPILIKQVGNQLIVIDGWHRVTAARMAGLSEVPARFAQLENPGQQLAVSIVLNSLQKSLNPLETAEGYERLVHLGLTQKEIALRAGKSEPFVSQHRKLNDLIPEAKKAYWEGKIKLKLTGLIALAKKTPDEQRAELSKICSSGSQGNGGNAGQGLIHVSREQRSPLADRIKKLKNKVEGISNADNHWALISRELTDLQATIARILADNSEPAGQ